MIKLNRILPITENRIQRAEEELQKYTLKGWSLVGCSTYYLVVEKELDAEEVIVLKEFENAAEKETNVPLIYIIKKNGLYGLADEYGIEILPCCYVKCDYVETQQYAEFCPDIKLYKGDEVYTYDRRTSMLE